MPSARKRIAEVALPLPVADTFHYIVPSRFAGSLKVGSRVTVPFQRRVLTGYVVSTLQRSEIEDLKEIADVPDVLPTFDEHMLELTRWVSEYYFCSWGEALACAAPPGATVEGKRVYRILAMPEFGTQLSRREQEVIAFLKGHGEQTLAQLQRATGARALQNALGLLESKGIVESRCMVPRSRIGPKKVFFATALVSPQDSSGVVEELRKIKIPLS